MLCQDGPSAGVAVLLALASLILNRCEVQGGVTCVIQIHPFWSFIFVGNDWSTCCKQDLLGSGLLNCYPWIGIIVRGARKVMRLALSIHHYSGVQIPASNFRQYATNCCPQSFRKYFQNPDDFGWITNSKPEAVWFELYSILRSVG